MSTPFETVSEAACALDDVPALPAVDETPKIEGTPLDDEHQRHIGWLVGQGLAEMDAEHKCLRTRTDSLAAMHEALSLKGEFATLTTASSERNCFAYPKAAGAWFIVRFGKGVKEHQSWRTSARGWTVCDFNVAPSKATDDPAAQIVRLALERCTLFHDPANQAYVETKKDGRRITQLVTDEMFGHMLRMAYTVATQKVAKAEQLRNAIAQLTAMAVETGKEYPVFCRLGTDGNNIYFDLADAEGRIVEITKDKWRVMSADEVCPVRFRRPSTMLPLPVPERGGDKLEVLAKLKPFFGVREEDFALLLGALVMCFNPWGPFPIVLLLGRPGDGKSSIARAAAKLVDPTHLDGSNIPANDEDMAIRAQDGWLLIFDNVSKIDQELSDWLCRLSTGSAYGKRKLYTDSGQTVFRAKRPVIVTAVNDVVKAGDLLDRALRFELPALKTRRTERDLDAEFNSIRASAMGLLLDGVVSAMKNEAATIVENPPRLFDFARWATAAEAGLGLKTGAFMASYRANRADVRGMILDDELGRQIIKLGDFSGTANELSIRLGWSGLSEQQLKDRVGELRKLAPALEGEGVTIEFRSRSHGKRLIVIRCAGTEDERSCSGAHG
jgi:hypothetical protein